MDSTRSGEIEIARVGTNMGGRPSELELNATLELTDDFGALRS